VIFVPRSPNLSGVNGVHDLGGQHGHGPVVSETDEPVFHKPWEGRVYALMTLARRAGLFNVDEMRRTIEQMPPADYLQANYYERWLDALERLVAEKGVEPVKPVPINMTPPHLDPRFKVGDEVQTRHFNPRHHTRLARYARGKTGVVELIHGPYALPDHRAHGKALVWQPVYTIRFNARELWGEDGNPHDSVSMDLWEEYLE
jgi:nitrile hydratase subunit beta